MKKMMKAITIVMIMVMGMSVYTAHAATKTKEVIVENETWDYYKAYEDLIKKDATKAQKEALKKLFQKIEALEKEASSLWEEVEASKIIDFNAGAEQWTDNAYTFELFKEDLKKDLSKTVLTEVEKLFDQAMALEKEKKYDEADKVWTKIYEKDIFNYDIIEGTTDGLLEPYTLEIFKETLKKDVSKAVLAEVEKLFNEAIALEKKDAYDEADKIWDKIYDKDIFDKSGDCDIMGTDEDVLLLDEE